ncbi:phytoene dehydrogenase [Halobacteriales archaeon QS_8_69_73]|nr:MAG: phytoene dehydrogenase [Halobacteriales archaeon QS_8_69_73]
MHVVVAGGGLAGLVAARHLAAAGAAVELLEADERVGGRVRSRVVDGFTLDRGFQVLFTGYPAARRELDLEALSLRRFAPGATIAAPNRRSTLSDPLGDPGAAVPTLLNREVTIGDKLRLLRLQVELRRRDADGLLDGADTSVRAYLRNRGFSEAFVERFAEPFYGGITLERSLSTSSHVFEYTFKMLSEGDTVVPAAGMGAIPAQLRRRAETAGATVETGREVTDVVAGDGDGAGVTVETDAGSVAADAAVVATDPKRAAELTGVETPTDAKACVTVHCSLPAHQSLDTGSRIMLNAADARPNTVAPMSAAASEYAPDDRQLLAATFLGEQDAGDAALGETVREALSSWYPENHFGDLEVLAVDRIDFAQFAQPPGFRTALPAVDAPEGPVYLAGDYTEWSAIQGAMESGRRAAETVRARLQ